MAVSSVAGANSPGAFVMQQLRTQQVERTAEQAEANARTLRREAASAQQEADAARENARDLKVRSDRAESQAGSARQAVVSQAELSKVGRSFEALGRSVASSSPEPTPTPAPQVNAEGQTTGTVINVTA